jgi:hypothetical protein
MYTASLHNGNVFNEAFLLMEELQAAELFDVIRSAFAGAASGLTGSRAREGERGGSLPEG